MRRWWSGVGVALLVLLLQPAGVQARLNCVVARDVPDSVKQEMYRKAGIPKAEQSQYRIDHRIPLELCGSNDRSNLQIQTVADSAAKDWVEGYLRREVEAGRMTLPQAQGLVLRWRHVLREHWRPGEMCRPEIGGC